MKRLIVVLMAPFMISCYGPIGAKQQATWNRARGQCLTLGNCAAYQVLLQEQQAQQAAWQNAIRMLNDNLQRQQDRDALMLQQQQPLAPTTCYTQYLGNGQTRIQCF